MEQYKILGVKIKGKGINGVKDTGSYEGILNFIINYTSWRRQCEKW